MNHATDDQKKLQQCNTSEPYHTPRLIRYGSLRELTAAGSTGDLEAGSSSKNKRP